MEWYWWLLIVLAVVIIVRLLLLWARSRSMAAQTDPEAPESPAVPAPPAPPATTETPASSAASGAATVPESDLGAHGIGDDADSGTGEESRSDSAVPPAPEPPPYEPPPSPESAEPAETLWDAGVADAAENATEPHEDRSSDDVGLWDDERRDTSP